MSEVQIHTHMSGESGIFANAYLVEGKQGVVAIDATLTVSESKRFRQRLEALNKPLLGVLITHPHPDHVAGIAELVGTMDVPILALPTVAALMRTMEEPKRVQWEPVFQQEWVPRWAHPTRLVTDGEAVSFGELLFRVHDFGPGGDSEANAIWVLESGARVAFVGDLVFNGTHSYIADGNLKQWLENLTRARTLLAGVSQLYPGHGPAAGLALLSEQERYLRAYQSAVAELAAGRPALDDQARELLVTRMQEFLPDAGLAFMIGLSADAVAAELAGTL